MLTYSIKYLSSGTQWCNAVIDLAYTIFTIPICSPAAHLNCKPQQIQMLLYGNYGCNKMVPLDFWSRKLPKAATRYAPFGKQLLSSYWVLVKTERQMVTRSKRLSETRQEEHSRDLLLNGNGPLLKALPNSQC